MGNSICLYRLHTHYMHVRTCIYLYRIPVTLYRIGNICYYVECAPYLTIWYRYHKVSIPHPIVSVSIPYNYYATMWYRYHIPLYLYRYHVLKCGIDTTSHCIGIDTICRHLVSVQHHIIYLYRYHGRYVHVLNVS